MYCLQICEYLQNGTSDSKETRKQGRSPYLATYETIRWNLSLVQTMRVFAQRVTYICVVILLVYHVIVVHAHLCILIKVIVNVCYRVSLSIVIKWHHKQNTLLWSYSIKVSLFTISFTHLLNKQIISFDKNVSIVLPIYNYSSIL